MPAIVRLSLEELDKMIADIEARGGDAEHLRAAGILDEDSYSKFTYELATFRDSHFEELINKFSTCICRK